MTVRPEGNERYWADATFDALEAFEREAAERDVSMAAFAVAWLLHTSEITAVVVGPNSAEQLAPVREALGVQLSEHELRRLRGLFA
jgi:aryl-alcohol dehydrogenase-like predicted oxidoreductase